MVYVGLCDDLRSKRPEAWYAAAQCTERWERLYFHPYLIGLGDLEQTGLPIPELCIQYAEKAFQA